MVRAGRNVSARAGRRQAPVVALAAAAAVLLASALLSWVGPAAPAGAAPEAYDDAATTTTIDLVGGPAVTSQSVSSGALDAVAGTFTAVLGPSGGLFPFTPPGYQVPFEIRYDMSQPAPATGTVDAAAGTATLTASLVFALSTLRDEGGAVIADLAPCRFTLPISAAGSYEPTTGLIDVVDAAVVVPPTADGCGGDIQKDDLNGALAGTGRSVHLVLDLPSPDAPPTVTAITPDHGPVGTVVHLTGTELRQGATTVHFGDLTIDPADVDVALGGNDARITVPAAAVPGAYAVTASTASGTSAPLTFVVQATGPSPLEGSATFGTVGPIALVGTADSVLLASGALTTHLTFGSGELDWSTAPGEDIQSSAKVTYDLGQLSGGTGAVDAAAGTAVLDVVLQLRARVSEISLVGGGPGTGMYYRYPFPAHLVGTYDPATGAVVLTADPVTIPETNDQGDFYPEDIERLIANRVLTGSDNSLTVRFTLPPAVDPPPPTTTTTTTVTTTTTSTPSTSTTTLPATTSTAVTTTTEASTGGGAGSPTTTTTTTEPAPGAPRIDSVSPSEGGPGTVVTVTGANFVVGGTTVELGGVSVPAVVSPDRITGSSLTFVVPADAPDGVNDLRVVTAGGSSASQPFTVTDAVPPVTAPPGSGPGGVATTTGPSPGGSGGSPAPSSSGSSGTGLARTGSPLIGLGALGVALLLAGLALAAASRGRSADAVDVG